MANRYYIGPAGGAWNNNANWDVASGGPGPASFPVAGDNAFLDAASPGGPTLTAAADCDQLDCTGFVGTFDQAGFTLTIHTTLFRLVAGMTFIHNNGLIDFVAAAGTVLITSGGQQLGSVRVGNVAVGGTYQLQDALDVLLDLDCVRGTFQFNNFNAAIRRDFYIRATMVANGVSLGSGTIDVYRDLETRIVNVISLTSMGTSTFRMVGTGAMRLYGNTGQNFYNLHLAEAGQTITITQNNAAFGNHVCNNVFTTGPGTIQAGGVNAQYLSPLAVRFRTGGPATPIDMDAATSFSLTPSVNGLSLAQSAAGQVGTFTFKLPTVLNAPFGISTTTAGNSTFLFGRACTITGNLSLVDGSSSGGPLRTRLNGFNVTVTGSVISGSAGSTGHSLDIGSATLTTGLDLALDWNISAFYSYYLNVDAGGVVNVGRDFFLGRVITGPKYAPVKLASTALITVGRNWDSSGGGNTGPTFTLPDNGEVRFTAAGGFTIQGKTTDYWPVVSVTGGGSTTLPNFFNCYDLLITAGLITAGATLTVRRNLVNGGTFTAAGTVNIGSSFVSTGTLIVAGSNVRATGAVCSVSGLNPVTLTMTATCGRLQLLTAMNITTALVIEPRVVPGVLQFLAGGAYNIAALNSQVVYPDAPVQLISSVAGTRYLFNVAVATSLAHLWPRDNNATGGIALTGDLTNKDLGNNLGWTLNTPGFISVITEDVGQDLLAVGAISMMQYCWLVDTTLAGLTAKAAAFLAGANNWHRSGYIPFEMLDNLSIGTTYFITLGLVDDRNNRVVGSVGAGDYSTVTVTNSDSGTGVKRSRLVVTPRIGSAA